jgi:hypothetical protein
MVQFDLNRGIGWLEFQLRKPTLFGRLLKIFLAASFKIKYLLKKTKPDLYEENNHRNNSKINASLDGKLNNKIWRHSRYPELKTPNLLTDSDVPGRVILYTSDSTTRGSFFGGFTTAVIVAAKLALELNRPLEIWEMSGQSLPSAINEIIKRSLEKSPTAILIRSINSQLIKVTPKDIFIATSWWSFKSLSLANIPIVQILYLVQEDETIFYPASDLSLEAEEAFNNAENLIINSNILYTHFLQKNPSLLKKKCFIFEPAVGPSNQNSVLKQKEKVLTFYARPNHPRNLYNLGADVIEELELSGSIPNDWELIFLGSSLPENIELVSGRKVRVFQDLSYEEYLSVLHSTSVGLSLMYAPHPSYPPLEMATRGAYVISTKYGVKTNLDMYNPKILLVNPKKDELVQKIAETIAKVDAEGIKDDESIRTVMPSNWHDALSGLKIIVQRDK